MKMSDSCLVYGLSFCCCLSIFFIPLVLYNMIHSSPDFKLEKLYIPALDKALNSCSDTTLTFDIAFLNYGGLKVYYDPINVSFYDNPNKNHSIANFTIPGFFEDTEVTEEGEAPEPKVVHKGGTVNITGLDVKTAIKEIMINGFKVFRVDLSASMRYELYWFWKTERYQYNKGFDVKIDDTGNAANIDKFFGVVGVLILNLILTGFLY